MVVLPPPMASTEEWLSGDAPRQFVHPEKRAALEKVGYRMLEVRSNDAARVANVKWQRLDGTTVTRGGVAALLKEALSPGSELDRLLKLKGGTSVWWHCAHLPFCIFHISAFCSSVNARCVSRAACGRRAGAASPL